MKKEMRLEFNDQEKLEEFYEWVENEDNCISIKFPRVQICGRDTVRFDITLREDDTDFLMLKLRWG